MTFTAADALPAGTKVRYRLSGEIVGEEPVSGTNWTWKAPSTDFKGYMAELYRQENGTDVIVGTIAVDVSSHPARFPDMASWQISTESRQKRKHWKRWPI